MSDQHLYSVREEVVIAFFERARNVVQSRDLEAWEKLFRTFEATSARPYIGSGGHIYPPDRLTRIEYQTNLPDLSHEQVPEWESRSLRWLLRRFVLIAADLSFVGGWSKFAQWFSINLSDELRANPGPELEEHEALMGHFFESRRPFPELLQLLRLSDSAFQSYVSVSELGILVALEARIGLLRRLAGEYTSSSDPITRELGAEIAALYQFLHLVHVQGRGIYYCQFAT